jgi:hypothetical protein
MILSLCKKPYSLTPALHKERGGRKYADYGANTLAEKSIVVML